MRAVCVAFCALTLSCATTVHRLDGQVQTSGGTAQNDCEKEQWLVIAPTRAEYGEAGSKTTEKRDDGLGLYRVGSSSPESIPRLSDEFPQSDMLRRHANAVSKYDDQRLLAAGLGAAGVIALGIGSVLFVNAFETTTDANGDEKQTIDSSSAVAGGLVFATGFGLGIAGIIISPNQAERSRADASRHVFFPPEDREKDVESLVDTHNTQVRSRCEQLGGNQ